MEKRGKSFGYSLHLNLYDCLGSIECFRKPGKDKDNGALILKIFVDYVLSLIDMKPIYEPLVKYYGDHDWNKGYSYLQLINTSNINIHTVSSTKSVYIDIFSCRQFDVEKVRSYCKVFWIPSEMNYDFLER